MEESQPQQQISIPSESVQTEEPQINYGGDKLLKKWKPNILMWAAAIILLAAAILNLYGALTTPQAIKTVSTDNLSVIGSTTLQTTRYIAPNIWDNNGKLALAFIAVTLIPVVFFAKKTLTN